MHFSVYDGCDLYELVNVRIEFSCGVSWPSRRHHYHPAIHEYTLTHAHKHTHTHTLQNAFQRMFYILNCNAICLKFSVCTYKMPKLNDTLAV